MTYYIAIFNITYTVMLSHYNNIMFSTHLPKLVTKHLVERLSVDLRITLETMRTKLNITIINVALGSTHFTVQS